MKKTKKEILKILEQSNTYLKNEKKLYDMTRDLKKRDGEHYMYDSYYDILDMHYLVFTGEHRDEREKKFSAPALPKSGQVISWIYRDPSWAGGFKYDEFDPQLMKSRKYYNRTGYIGDIITDIVLDPKIRPETKFNMLTKFFKLQDELYENGKRIP